MKKKRRNKKLSKMFIQYSWIFGIAGALFLLAYFTYPDKKNALEYIEKRMNDIQMQREFLTDKEKQLEKLATDKEWEEVDNDNNK
tara:strand:- start:683 stop:937 length:255 start_codon:yes stop_codon:yes gene_type:complete